MNESDAPTFEMIEFVARSICDKENDDPCASVYAMIDENKRNHYRQLAVTAIAATRSFMTRIRRTNMAEKHLTMTDAEVCMTPEQIRATARKLDKIARDDCPQGCRPDLVIGAAIDHLYAIAAAEQFRPR